MGKATYAGLLVPILGRVYALKPEFVSPGDKEVRLVQNLQIGCYARDSRSVLEFIDGMLFNVLR